MPISREPPRHGKRDDGIETDAGEHEAETGEDGEQRGHHRRRRLRFLQSLRHRLRRDRR
jgi:hypothetical protein